MVLNMHSTNERKLVNYDFTKREYTVWEDQTSTIQCQTDEAPTLLEYEEYGAPTLEYEAPNLLEYEEYETPTLLEYEEYEAPTLREYLKQILHRHQAWEKVRRSIGS